MSGTWADCRGLSSATLPPDPSLLRQGGARVEGVKPGSGELFDNQPFFQAVAGVEQNTVPDIGF